MSAIPCQFVRAVVGMLLSLKERMLELRALLSPFTTRTLRRLAPLLVPFVLGACAVSADGEGGQAESITTIPESAVKDQAETGNCWLYATMAWTESLSAEANGSAKQSYSPAYLNYWDFYDQITDGDAKRTTVDYGGTWGAAVELVSRYGIVPMGRFVRDEAGASIKAQAALNRELTQGALKTASSRADLALVRRVMDKAWGLTPGVSAALTTAFGADGAATFDLDAKKKSYASAALTISRSSDVSVRLVGSTKAGTLADLIGTRAAGDDPGARVGTHAWSVAAFDYQNATPATWRKHEQRLQRALNDGLPLPVAWIVSAPHLDAATSSFRGAIDPKPKYAYGTTGPVQYQIGGHETLLDDYQVENVPGYGTLQAGVQANKAAMDAALADSAHVVFFRVKNSWGTAVATPQKGKPPAIKDVVKKAGYYDLYSEYLRSTGNATYDGTTIQFSGLSEVVLPPGY